MCTASWLIGTGGYELFCNRDERKTRLPALSPRLEHRNGVNFIAPRDGDFGGSWIGVNEFGLGLCLLNDYSRQLTAPTANPISRGTLLISLLDCPTPAAVIARLRLCRLTFYQPFILLVLAVARPVTMVNWNGAELSVEPDARSPVTTSSFEPHVVQRCRREKFLQLGALTPAKLREFHQSRDARGGAYSVCMTRDDAATVSFSHIRVTAEQIEFDYWPRGDDVAIPDEATTISCPRLVNV